MSEPKKVVVPVSVRVAVLNEAVTDIITNTLANFDDEVGRRALKRMKSTEASIRKTVVESQAMAAFLVKVAKTAAVDIEDLVRDSAWAELDHVLLQTLSRTCDQVEAEIEDEIEREFDTINASKANRLNAFLDTTEGRLVNDIITKAGFRIAD